MHKHHTVFILTQHNRILRSHNHTPRVDWPPFLRPGTPSQARLNTGLRRIDGVTTGKGGGRNIQNTLRVQRVHTPHRGGCWNTQRLGTGRARPGLTYCQSHPRVEGAGGLISFRDPIHPPVAHPSHLRLSPPVSRDQHSRAERQPALQTKHTHKTQNTKETDPTSPHAHPTRTRSQTASPHLTRPGPTQPHPTNSRCGMPLH